MNNMVKTEKKILEELYSDLIELVSAECNVPEDFFKTDSDKEKYCYYVFSMADCKFHFVDKGYKLFTGHSIKEHQNGGLDFWFSNIHPDDRKMLADNIIESQRTAKSLYNKLKPVFRILNYRFRKGTGEWIWMQHTVCILSLDSSGKTDKMLHRLSLIDILSLPDNLSKNLYDVSLKECREEGVGLLTRREKQILKLIAEGFSSKIIAHQLHISIHTVETHRRHLLGKLNAKNSMELVKRAFHMFWN